MRTTTSIAILCMLVLCAGCGSGSKIRKLSASSIVVAFGDSLTSGTGASQEESYPSVLSAMIGYKVVNAGVAGEDSSAGLSRLPTVLKNERPDLVILCMGGNDMLRGQDTSVTIANLNAMISMVKDTGADVVLIGVPKPALFLKPAPFYEEIAAKQGIAFDVEAVSRILSTPGLTSDPVHPNANGYRRLAEAIKALITKSQREYLNSFHHTGLKNLLDQAILDHEELKDHLQADAKSLFDTMIWKCHASTFGVPATE
jgi:lysophospholipase L1-like esterase